MSSELNPAWAAPCGVWCRDCPFFESPRGLSCGGCNSDRFCRPEEQCEFVRCVRSRGIEHCGLCGEFPCEQLIGNYQICTGESSRIAIFRIGDLAIRARLGTTEWMKRKAEGALACESSTEAKADAAGRRERRGIRRSYGQWQIPVSFLPAPAAFGLSQIKAKCVNASPNGLMLVLPENTWNGFAALVRTGRSIEVRGEFPSAFGPRPFQGKVVWHNLEQATLEHGLRVGVRLLISAKQEL